MFLFYSKLEPINTSPLTQSLNPVELIDFQSQKMKASFLNKNGPQVLRKNVSHIFRDEKFVSWLIGKISVTITEILWNNQLTKFTIQKMGAEFFVEKWELHFLLKNGALVFWKARLSNW